MIYKKHIIRMAKYKIMK